jgi:hypothetical protein
MSDLIQLKHFWELVVKIQGVSGWTWDEEHGASITPEQASSWDAFVAKNPKAKPFQNGGFAHYDVFMILFSPNNVPEHGKNIYWPSTGQQDYDLEHPEALDEAATQTQSTVTESHLFYNYIPYFSIFLSILFSFIHCFL